MSLDSPQMIPEQFSVRKIIAHEIQPEIFRATVNELKGKKITLGLNEWVETTLDNSVENKFGGQPCLAIFAVLPNDKMIAGHFVNFTQRTLQEMHEASDDYVKRLALEHPDNTFSLIKPKDSDFIASMEREAYVRNHSQVYEEMMARIKDLQQKQSNDRPQIFLFGQRLSVPETATRYKYQHDPEQPDTSKLKAVHEVTTIKDIMERNDVLFDLAKIGIPGECITDLRYPHVRPKGGDFSLYDASKKEIVFTRT